MPGIAHFVYGFALIIPLMLIAKEKMNYKALVIFIWNQWLGPDSYYPFVFTGIYGHTIIGFIIWAVPLAFFYSYLSRFTVNKKLEIIDEGKIEVNWRNSYFLVIAGGLSHFFIDMIGHHGFKIHMLPDWFENFGIGIDLSLVDIQSWGSSYYHEFGALVLIGYIVQFLTAYLMMHYLQQNVKDQYIFLLSIIGVSTLLVLILGGEVFAELEVSMFFVIILFFLIPLTLLYYTLNDIHEHPSAIEPRESNPKKKLNIISFILLLFFGLLIVIGIVAVILNVELAELISQVDAFIVLIAGIGVIILASIVFTLVLLMILLKNETLRRIVVFLNMLLFITIIGAYFAFVLSENEVKELFRKKS